MLDNNASGSLDGLQLRVNHNDVNHGAETQSSLSLSDKTERQSATCTRMPTMEICRNRELAEHEVCGTTTSVIGRHQRVCVQMANIE
jgi:hypothetical protein